MKARVLTWKERQAGAQVANQIIDEMAPAIVQRTLFMVLTAMMDAGESPEKINEVLDHMPYATDVYAKFKEDKIADFALYITLKEYGVNIQMEIPPEQEQ